MTCDHLSSQCWGSATMQTLISAKIRWVVWGAKVDFLNGLFNLLWNLTKMFFFLQMHFKFEILSGMFWLVVFKGVFINAKKHIHAHTHAYTHMHTQTNAHTHTQLHWHWFYDSGLFLFIGSLFCNINFEN